MTLSDHGENSSNGEDVIYGRGSFMNLPADDDLIDEEADLIFGGTGNNQSSTDRLRQVEDDHLIYNNNLGRTNIGNTESNLPNPGPTKVPQTTSQVSFGSNFVRSDGGNSDMNIGGLSNQSSNKSYIQTNDGLPFSDNSEMKSALKKNLSYHSDHSQSKKKFSNTSNFKDLEFVSDTSNRSNLLSDNQGNRLNSTRSQRNSFALNDPPDTDEKKRRSYSLPKLDPPTYKRQGANYVQIPPPTNRRFKSRASYLFRYRMSRKERSTVSFGFLFIIAGVVSIAYGILKKPEIPDGKVPPSAPSPTFINLTPYPTPNSSPIIIDLPTTPSPTFRYDNQLTKITNEILQALNDPQITGDGPPYSVDIFFDYDSPQFKALQWLAIRDRYYIPFGMGGADFMHRWLIALFYFQFQGETWRSKSNWTSNTNECDWQGITCGDIFQNGTLRVTGINFNNNNLQGEIPSEIVYLIYLEEFRLGRNHLIGTIPSEIAGMKNLKHLELKFNEGLFSTIPSEIALIPNLKELDLEKCSLSGTLPIEIELLGELEALNLNSNSFIGFIPEQLGNLKSLRKLQLGNNGFYSTIPTQLGELSNLNLLGLWSNDLRGNIPTEFSNLINLEYLYLDNNDFVGPIPEFLGDLPLIDLILAENRFKGEIPISFGKLSKLNRLWLSKNELTGTIPIDLFFLSSNLHALYVDYNKFSGTIPPQISNLRNIEDFRINNNLFSGCLSRQLFELPYLRVLYADTNKFECNPPDFFLNSRSIVDLQLQNNRFNGNLPKLGWNSSPLEVLNLSSNKFNGNIPITYGKFQNLVKLDLSNNNLQGPIPSEISYLSSLEKCNLSHNSLTGTLGTFVNNKQLKQLELQNNKIDGVVPTIFGNFNHLNILKIEINDITGSMPFDVCKLNLEELTADCLSEVQCRRCCTGCM